MLFAASHLLVTREVMYATSCISTMKLLELVSMLSEVPMRVNSWSTTLQHFTQVVKCHEPRQGRRRTCSGGHIALCVGNPGQKNRGGLQFLAGKMHST